MEDAAGAAVVVSGDEVAVVCVSVVEVTVECEVELILGDVVIQLQMLERCCGPTPGTTVR